MVAWLLVIVASLFETGFAVPLKQSHGITRFWPTVGFAACALVSFGLILAGVIGLKLSGVTPP